MMPTQSPTLVKQGPTRATLAIAALLGVSLAACAQQRLDRSGAAMNNRGAKLLAEGNLRASASAFREAHAREPDHPTPLYNLALAMERDGRLDDALATYALAIDRNPAHMPSLQARTRLRLRRGETASAMREDLERIALEGEPGVWRAWAQSLLREQQASDAEAR